MSDVAMRFSFFSLLSPPRLFSSRQIKITFKREFIYTSERAKERRLLKSQRKGSFSFFWILFSCELRFERGGEARGQSEKKLVSCNVLFLRRVNGKALLDFYRKWTVLQLNEMGFYVSWMVLFFCFSWKFVQFWFFAEILIFIRFLKWN